MLKSGSTERHPFTSLLLLLLLMLAGAFVFTVIAFIAVTSIYGIKAIGDLSQGETSSLAALKLLQIFISTGMFVVPAVFFARMESSNWMDYLKLQRFPIILIFLTILLMFSALPMLDLSSELNKNMKFPPFLKGGRRMDAVEGTTNGTDDQTTAANGFCRCFAGQFIYACSYTRIG